MNWYSFDILPVAASRPRANFKTGTVHTAPKYDKYKTALTFLFKRTVPKGDYSCIEIEFYFPYPKSEAKKNRLEGRPHQKKPDGDNIVKGVLDALEQAGVFLNDSRISDMTIRKRYTTEGEGRIRFCLFS